MDHDWQELRQVLTGGAAGAKMEKCDVEGNSTEEELIVKETICYIVAGVLFNEKQEVLMVQEAKPSCYQKWYLPAGRMEQNETIADAAKREVLEETGLHFEPESVACVEECGGRWVRFALTGKVTGGTLKTTKEADEDSLQAMWWSREDAISLRCKDILPVIEIAERKNKALSNHTLLPALQPHKLLFLRTLFVHCEKATGDEFYSILLCRGVNGPKDPANSCGTFKLPTTRIHLEDTSFNKSVKNLCFAALEISDTELRSANIAQVLGIEHSGMSSAGLDGLGVSVLVNFSNSEDHNKPPPPCKDGFRWFNAKDIHSSAAPLLMDVLQACSSVPLRSLRAGSSL